jgi:glycosyltransferase involved in cell wall biosynthesis
MIGCEDKAKPLVSVYMPTHNRRPLVERAVFSVLNQTYPNFELLVVDDGSSDDTWDYLCSIDDSRVKVFRNDVPVGACAARNRAISEASGDFVTGLDDDDYFKPDRIMHLWEGLDIRFSLVSTKDFKLRHFFLSPIVYTKRAIGLPQLLNYNLIGSQCLVETCKVRSVGGFDENLPALQDYDLWVRLVQKFGPAKLKFSDTYVVDASHGRERVTNPRNRVEAYKIFYRKHKKIMTSGNLNSLRIRESEWSLTVVSWKSLFQASLDGNIRWVIRFLLKILKND